MSYSNPTSSTYRFAAETLSAAAEIGRLIGPAGKAGRLIDIACIQTTDVTVADTTIQLGDGVDADAYGTLTVPFADGVGDGANGMVRGVDHEIAPDTEVVITAGGECTAGAGDVLVTIEWY